MKSSLRSFKMFIRQIWDDSMLAAVIAAPLLAACFFRFGIPYIEHLLCGYFNKPAILADYYLLFDILLSVLTPYMFCFASSMVMLTEYDENITSFMAVTPVGKKGYLISHLAFPAILSFFVSILLMIWFTLTEWSLFMIVVTCLLTCTLSIVVSLFIFTFSHNRVEGMAVAKLSGLIILGLPIPFFIMSGIQYLFFPLPSLWLAKLCIEHNYFFVLPVILTSGIWLWLLYKKFDRKLT